eukprot:3704249-Rhodomonas_salina.1
MAVRLKGCNGSTLTHVRGLHVTAIYIKTHEPSLSYHWMFRSGAITACPRAITACISLPELNHTAILSELSILLELYSTLPSSTHDPSFCLQLSTHDPSFSYQYICM